ncbi:glycerol kinase GlpK [Sphingomonas sp. SUN039]|uniref:glycerol kinase GlpK n=1 Tax=Sphingomonas sp. SUN039 TaxID=2937787 RepID=UPI0021647540|nr:glycerol kinase GlpK [Sphingomonas sp. SUN039]UVO53867.1 glycerol kinase GlpK [Sphingomonas sp. SUN039]
MKRQLLAIDQGTTSSRAIRFSGDGVPLQTAQQDFSQIYPQPGWVEHDAETIWATTLAVTREAMSGPVEAIGITNQRETIVVWDRATGKPIHNAIVWQDRRTADLCDAMKADGIESSVQAKTGLLLDPYFSATKLKWLLDAVPAARDRAAKGELAAGTIDSFLLWRLTGGRVHATDWTNAGRTMLYDIHRRRWDAELLRLFDIPENLLPEVHPNAHHFGDTDPALFGRSIPILGMAGDQQAALIGQACFSPGMVKSTYGTGCFMLMNTGAQALASTHRLLTTPAYEVGQDRAYALEGSIFVAGAAVKWLRDKLCLVDSAQETETLACAAKEDHGVTVIPAFVGLGAPHWRADVRGSVHGLTLDTTAADLVGATLESIAFQTRDLTDAMAADGASKPAALRIDGGMAQNAWFAQFLSDILDTPVEMPASHETTALGAAALAGVGAGLFADAAAFGARWQAASRWTPQGTNQQARLDRWHRVLQQALAS